MTSFRLTYLAIAIDNLFIHELLGCMRCLFFKAVRSSRPEVFSKKGVLRIFAKFTGKHLCQSLFLNKETLAEVFSCDFCKIFSYRTPLTPFLTEHLWWLLLLSLNHSFSSVFFPVWFLICRNTFGQFQLFTKPFKFV